MFNLVLFISYFSQAAQNVIYSNPPRYSKSLDRRNHKDNVNFHNFKKKEPEYERMDVYSKNDQIATILDEALSNYNHKFDKFKRLCDIMDDIRSAIKANESITKEDDGQGGFNTVRWLYEEDKEEKKLSKDLQREVENKIAHENEKRDREAVLEEQHHLDEREETRERHNQFLQHLRNEYNVE